jgi:PHD/YefM family antitoxin component YafN of YafNO toxin-antitoxin module
MAIDDDGGVEIPFSVDMAGAEALDDLRAKLGALNENLDRLTAAMGQNATASTATAATFNRLAKEQDQATAAQARFISTLNMQAATLGKSGAALAAARAGVLGVAEAAAPAIAKLKEFEASQAAAREAARAETSAVRELASQLRALEESEAAAAQASYNRLLGVNQPASDSARVKGQVNGEALAGLLAQEEAEANAARAAAEAERQHREAADELIASLQRRILVAREGADALTLERAAELGVSDQARELIGVLNEEAEAKRAAAQATREFAASMREETGSAHLSSRALYEVSVLTHELTSGRIRQAISSFSILLNNIGLAQQAVLGFTLTIGLLYGISKPVEEAAKAMEALKRQSQELGVSTGFLQTMNAAATLTGVQSDKLVASIARLDTAFQRAKDGSKVTAAAFKEVGVSVRDNLSNEELVNKVLAGWDKLSNGPQKVTVAVNLFGRAGAQLVPVLDQMAAHMDEVNAKVKQFGLQNPAAVEQGAQIAARFRDAGLAAQGLGMAVLEKIGPAMQAMLDDFAKASDAVRKFLGDGDALRTTIDLAKDAVIGLSTFIATKFIGDMTKLAIETLAASNAFRAFAVSMLISGEVGGLAGTIETLNAAMVILAREGIASVIAGLRSLTIAIAANPIGLFAVAVAGVTTALFSLHDALKRQMDDHYGVAEAQKAQQRAQQDLITIQGEAGLLTKDQIKALEDQKTAELQVAQAKLASAQASMVKLQAEGAKIDANRKAAFVGGGYMGAGAMSGAGDASDVNQVAQGSLAKKLKEDQGTVDALKKSLTELQNMKPASGGTGLIPPVGGASGSDDRMEKWRSELEQLLVFDEDNKQAMLSDEIKFWTDKLATVTGNGKKEVELRSKIAYEIARDQIALYNLQSEETKKAAKQAEEIGRLQIDSQAAIARIGIDAQRKADEDVVDEHITALKRRMDAERVYSDADIAQMKAYLAQKEALEIAALGSKYTETTHQDASDSQNAADAGDQVGVAKADAKSKTDYAKYLADLNDLKARYAAMGVAVDDEATQKSLAAYKRLSTGILDSFRTTIEGLIEHTTSLHQVWLNMQRSMLDAFIRVGEGMIAFNLKKNTTIELQDRLAAVAAGKISLAKALVDIKNDAVQAASGAFKATVQIPYIGPILAPAAAVAAFGAVTAYESGLAAFSAAGGMWEVPSDGTRITAHAKEMVLPAWAAVPLRDMLMGQRPSSSTTNSRSFTNNGGMHFHQAPGQNSRDFAADVAAAFFEGKDRHMYDPRAVFG